MEISGASAVVGQDVTLTCTLLENVTGTLEYTWSAGGEQLQGPSSANDFHIFSVQVTEAQQYQCEVFKALSGGQAMLLGTGTQDLSVTCKDC